MGKGILEKRGGVLRVQLVPFQASPHGPQGVLHSARIVALPRTHGLELILLLLHTSEVLRLWISVLSTSDCLMEVPGALRRRKPGAKLSLLLRLHVVEGDVGAVVLHHPARVYVGIRVEHSLLLQLTRHHIELGALTSLHPIPLVGEVDLGVRRVRTIKLLIHVQGRGRSGSARFVSLVLVE